MKLTEISLSRKLFVANIRACYYAASQYPDILSAGLSWYERANQESATLAKRHRVSVETAIGVISALSPRNWWERNVVMADVCLRVVLDGGGANDFKVSTFDGNKHKAVAIARGSNPLTILSGDKTRSFYLNISNPEDSYTVTVDGHGAHIALGKVAALEDAPALKGKCYDFFADCYRQACSEINADSLVADILPCQVQSVTWQYYRVLKGLDKSFELA